MKRKVSHKEFMKMLDSGEISPGISPFDRTTGKTYFMQNISDLRIENSDEENLTPAQLWKKASGQTEIPNRKWESNWIDPYIENMEFSDWPRDAQKRFERLVSNFKL